MPARTPKEVGDAWGRLVGLAVDACQSHHAAHGDCDDEEARTPTGGDDNPRKRAPKKLGGKKKRQVPGGELDSVTLTESQRCPDSWTKTKGEVVVSYTAPAVSQLAHPAMHLLPADGALTNASYTADAPVDAPQGVSDVVVSLAAQLPMSGGLYIGRLRPVSGGQRDNPVVIYIDDVTP
jgi:hypothetical protein